MKFLIAFAVFAVAFTDAEAFRLREAPTPAVEGISDYTNLVKVVQSSTLNDAEEPLPISSTSNIVEVVDIIKGNLNPIGGVKASFEDAEPSYDRTIQFVDEAVNEEYLVKDSHRVKMVESPLEESAPSNLAVNVINEVVHDINDNKNRFVKVVENRLNEAAPSEMEVNVIDEAVNEEYLVNDSHRVKVVESPLEESAPSNLAVNGINEVVHDINDNKNRFVKVVENPLNEAAPSGMEVHVIDKAVNEEYLVKDSHRVKVVESPLKESAPSNLAFNVINEVVHDINDDKNSFVKVVENPLNEAAPSEMDVNVNDEAVNDINDNKNSFVKVVESPLEESAPSDLAVNVFDEVVHDINDDKNRFVKVMEKPLNEAAPLDMDVSVMDEAVNDIINDNKNRFVKVVESPLEESAPSGLTVNVVDEAVNDINDNKNHLIKVVESHLDEAAPSNINVNFVDEVENDLIDDESDKDEESPVQARPVYFVDEAVNKVVSQVELTPSFHSYAGISKLLEVAQDQEEKYVGSSTVIVVSPKVLNIPRAVKVVENVNMGHFLSDTIEDAYEDSVDVHAKAAIYDDGIPAKVVRVAEFPRGKVLDNPLLR